MWLKIQYMKTGILGLRIENNYSYLWIYGSINKRVLVSDLFFSKMNTGKDGYSGMDVTVCAIAARKGDLILPIQQS